VARRCGRAAPCQAAQAAQAAQGAAAAQACSGAGRGCEARAAGKTGGGADSLTRTAAAQARVGES